MVTSLEREDASPLLKREIMWRDRYTMLELHGYRLRQRYKPNWQPSWLRTKRLAFLHEDFHKRDSASSIDALRISDGRRVFLKRVPSNSQEIVIHRFLSQPDRLEDSNNHTAPLLDTFADDKYPHFSYLVLPLLRNYFDPEFYFVDEVVDFVGQLLDGLSYMHMAGVAHRDCSILNIMMDADPLFPKGFHPTASILDASGSKPAYPKRRRDVDGVRYYFIDFGISSKFELGEERKVTGIDGQDDEVPELSESVPYNPFQTDIFIIGNFIRKEFLKKYTNLNFLEPLVEDMIDQNPRERSKASDAKAIFERIVREQPRLTLRWRLKEKDSGPVTHFFQDVGSIYKETIILTKTTLGCTSPRILRNLLIEGTVKHSLNDRVEFAIRLAPSVLVVHSLGLVHKNIKPDAILVTESIVGEEKKLYPYKLGTPYLLSFDSSRSSHGPTMKRLYQYPTGANWETLYTHPRHFGWRPHKYEMRDDVFSLGVCLLELALWKSFFRWNATKEKYEDDTEVIDLTPTRLREEAIAQGKPISVDTTWLGQHIMIETAEACVPAIMGDLFKDVVVACLIFGDPHRLAKAKSSRPGSEIIRTFLQTSKVCTSFRTY